MGLESSGPGGTAVLERPTAATPTPESPDASEPPPQPESAEAVERPEIPKQKQLEHIDTVGSTVLSDVNSRLDKLTRAQREERFKSGDAKGRMEWKVRSAQRIASGKILDVSNDKGEIETVPVRYGPDDKPIIILYGKDGSETVISSIDSLDGEQYSCNGSGLKINKTDLANAHLIAEKTAILEGLPEEQRKAMEMYIDSLKPSDDRTKVFEGHKAADVNAAIESAADSLHLITTTDGARLISNLTREKINKLDKGAEDHEAKQNEVLEEGTRRMLLLEANGPSILMDAQTMSTLITDVAGYNPATIDTQITEVGDRLTAAEKYKNGIRGDLVRINVKTDADAKRKADLEKDLQDTYSRAAELRVEAERLKTLKETVVPEALTRQLESIANGTASLADRAKIKAGLSCRTVEDFMKESLQIDLEAIEQSSLSSIQKIQAKDEKRIKHEKLDRKVGKYALVGVGGIAAMIIFLMMSAGQGGH